LLGTLFIPSSPQADAIANMMLIVLVLAIIIFLIVTVFVSISSYKYRARPGDPPPKKNFGNVKLELFWTITPFVVLIAFFFLTAKTMKAVDPPPGDTEADLVITGHQWWWEIKYVNSGVLTANEIHLQVGKKYLVRLESGDVIHSLWVPALARKIDAIPGRQNYLYLQASEPGVYYGVCTEFCGTQHAGMRVHVYSHNEAEFKAWEAQQLVIPPTPSMGIAARGAKIFKEKTCYNCHTIAGTGAHQSIGPDLTYVATRHTLGAGVLKNSPENLAAWLHDPNQFKPGSHMPNFQLSKADVAALVAYLEGLK